MLKIYAESVKESLGFQFDPEEIFFTFSKKHVFRGMHFQGSPHKISKVVSIIQGKATDYLLDLRSHSSTFGNLQIVDLSEEDPSSIFIPTGIAHGYLSLSENTIISYMFDGDFCANCDTGISGREIEEFLPITFADAIKSERDQFLPSFEIFKYKTKCEPCE